MTKLNLLDLNVPKLFEERNVEEILEIDKLLDAEIEKKRTELRSMVGDRYKDILTATEAIKSMENISEQIVVKIDSVTDRCQILVENTSREIPKKALIVSREKIEERTILMQIRLAIVLNESIWLALDDEDFSKAAQYYLLAQHVHTGLRLLSRDIFEKYRIIKKIKATVDSLRERILRCTNEKLQTVELSTEDTCSNLNALMLLENHSCSDLLKKFIELRKNALTAVINLTHPSVRAQVSAMVKCLYTTVHLLHDCFLNYKDTNKGLIWHQLDAIVGASAPTTLSTVTALPETNLSTYIPEIIKQFRPKCSNANSNLSKPESVELVKLWMDDAAIKIEAGIEKALDLVPNVKGLHIIREEALKIDLPANWEEICQNCQLPVKLNIWYHFFQKYITKRAKNLITKNLSKLTSETESDLSKLFDSCNDSSELDLRWYVWKEEPDDVSRQPTTNQHRGLSMKTKGYSPSIVTMCSAYNDKCQSLMDDVALYLYGDCQATVKVNVKKFVDREVLEMHLKQDSSQNVNKLIVFLRDKLSSTNEDPPYRVVVQSVMAGRFLAALTNLCPALEKACTPNNQSDDWDAVCSALDSASLAFWDQWIQHVVLETTNTTQQHLNNIDTLSMLNILCSWDVIEIQEQTDERTFKSEIKVPMKPSVALQAILNFLCDSLDSALPHTLPRLVHSRFVERNVRVIFDQYERLLAVKLTQTQALQFLFDVKFLTTLCVARENLTLVQMSQGICDKLRAVIDPFDLDVFYKYLQHNVKQSVLQSQVILGSLLPSSGQLSSLGVLERGVAGEEPSVLALSTPSGGGWFTLLPVTAPAQKATLPSNPQPNEANKVGKVKAPVKKSSDTSGSVRSGAAALFGMTSEWFS